MDVIDWFQNAILVFLIFKVYMLDNLQDALYQLSKVIGNIIKDAQEKQLKNK